MKIGIDAKWFFNGPPSGRVVVRNLLENLIELSEGHQIYVFLKNEDKLAVFPYIKDNVFLVHVWGGNNMLANVFVVPFVAFKYKLDVLIFQNFAPFISNFRRISFIHDFIFLSNPEYFTLKERIYFYPISILSRLSHRICTVSESEKKRISHYLPNTSDKIDVIYNGINSTFRPLELHDNNSISEVISKYNLPKRFVLYTGRVNIRKNIKNLILSLPIVHDKEIKLVIAGPHDNNSLDITGLARNIGMENRIHVTGFVDEDDLPILYSLATIFCFPSFEEGFGIPPLESMASGVPAVVSDRSSLPEICGEAGIYIDPNSPESIAEAIDELLGNPDYYATKRDSGLKRVKQFEWKSSASSLLNSAIKTVKS